MQDRISHHRKIPKEINSRIRTCWTTQITNLPQIYMPVRLSYRGQEVQPPHFLAWKPKPHGVPITPTPLIEAPPKFLGKLASRSSVQLQLLQISRTSCSQKITPLAPLSHHGRIGILPLTGLGASPILPRLASLPPTNTPLRNINPQRFHTHRWWTDSWTSTRNPAHKGRINYPKQGKIHGNPPPWKSTKTQHAQIFMETDLFTQQNIRNLHSLCSLRRNINWHQKRILQWEMRYIRSDHISPRIQQTPNRFLLHLSRAHQRPRLTHNWTIWNIKCGINKERTFTQIQYHKRANNSGMWWPQRDKKFMDSETTYSCFSNHFKLIS